MESCVSIDSLSINVYSEIGVLKKVLLHRPGKEIENLVPDYLGRLLFDDIPYLKVAQQEHDKFSDVLRENGVEVVYVENLIADVLNDDDIKNEFIEEFLNESGIILPVLKDALKEYLFSMDTEEMIDTIIAGIRKDDVRLKKVNSLTGIIKDDYPFYLDPMPNLYFTRDIGASIGNGLSISRMKTEARRRETLFIKYIHKYHDLFKDANIPLWYDRTMPFSIEGGDELILSDEVMAIGCSERTSSEAIEILAKNLLNGKTSFKKILVFEIPKARSFMHLDTVFTMVDYDKFTIHSGIQGNLNVYEISSGSDGALKYRNDTNSLENILSNALGLDYVELIKCGGGDPIISGREQWNDGSNTLAIAPGVVVTYERNYVSNELLEKRGIKVLRIPSAELSRGRGGPRCMSMPLVRENLR